METYLASVVEGIPPLPDCREILPETYNPASASEVFSVLTSRAFCYLGRNKVECYKDDVVASLRKRMAAGQPLRFFYDIGPGYHATPRPGMEPLRFDVGLSELFMLSQVNALCRRIAEFYEPGARFFFVVDNLCGLRTNDIPLDLTQGYVRQFRHLIDQIRMSNRVQLVVESEEFDLREYDRMLADVETQPPVAEPPPEAIDNVARFLGRSCTAEEAASRMELYRRTGSVTDQLLNRMVQEVHMTQRATGATLGFRAFPGGAQRTQVGELMLTRRPDGRIGPLLITSRNVDQYTCVRLEFPELLPPPITHVMFASPRPDSPDASSSEVTV